MPTERRLAAIMFTDIVGSTAVTARSEAAGLTLRDRHRELVRAQVDRYHGRFIEAPGDESLSTFESAVDAVHAALAVQQELEGDAELQVRIGIHTGETIFRGDEVFGDGVNIAARVRELADPCQILASAEVARAVQNQANVYTASRGEHHLKGIGEPVSVYAVSDAPVASSVAPQRAAGRWFTAAGVAALAAVVGLAWWLYEPPPTTDTIRSIAVLPLENLSGDPEQEYFADGMTEALIAELGNVAALSVISRTSVMRYKRADKSVPEIADELGVDAVVEGSILRAGDRVRITTQLIQGSTDRHLWAQSYERDLRDILALQGEVARAIAQEVQVKLTPGEQQRLSTVRALDPAAHEAYLKGRFHLNKHNREGYARAIEYFRAALDRDPEYALAHTGLAEVYLRLPAYEETWPRDAYSRAQIAVGMALALDDSLADAHAGDGAVRMWLARDLVGARQALERALELNPSSSLARLWYASLLGQEGRWEESLQQNQRALALDPLSLLAHVDLAIAHIRLRQYDLAMEQLRAALELDADFIFANLWLGMLYSYQLKHEQAIAQLERTAELAGQEYALWPELAHAHARAGHTEEARRLADRAVELSKTRYIIPTILAELFAGLGDYEAALEWLERGYEQHDRLLKTIAWRPGFDSMRSDPRLQDLLRRIGFPES